MASNNLNLRRSAHTAGLCILWCVGLQRLNPSLSKEWPSDSVQPTSTRSSRGARAKQYSPVTTQRGWREKKRISCLLLSALLLWDFLLTCAFRQMKGSADLQKSPQYILHCMMINSWLLSSWCLSKSIFYYFLFLFLHTHSLYSLKKILNGWETVYRNFYVFPLFQNLTIFFIFFMLHFSWNKQMTVSEYKTIPTLWATLYITLGLFSQLELLNSLEHELKTCNLLLCHGQTSTWNNIIHHIYYFNMILIGRYTDTIQLIVTFLHLNTLTFVFNLISIIYFQLNALRFEFCLKLCQARGTDTHTHTHSTRHVSNAVVTNCCHTLFARSILWHSQGSIVSTTSSGFP